MVHFSIENLSFSYPGATQVTLRSLNLDIEYGEYLVVCGRSGCGKTTLLRHLKPDLVLHGQRQGSVYIEGRLPEHIEPRDLAAHIGFVMQDPEAQIVTEKVWHELAFGLESLGMPQEKMRVRVAEVASFFGIEHWFHQDLHTLSGGQKQLVNLASVMACQPRALVLDEPTSQLDPVEATEFLSMLYKINRDLGITVIVSEHRLEEVFPVADRVVVMETGSFVALGSPREVARSLYDMSHDMAAVLPTASRVFYGLCRKDMQTSHNGGSCADSACPLSVREGRLWLSRRVSKQVSIRTLSQLCSDDVAERAKKCIGKTKVSHPVLSAHDVWFRYEKTAPDVLQGLDLAIAPGEIHVILGGNGSGKSTLLRAWCGIVAPYRGKLCVCERSLKAWKFDELFRENLALLPQDPKALFVGKTVREDLEEMLFDSQDNATNRRSLIEYVAHQVNLSGEVFDRHPYDLSGGQQQRLALAKVLLCKPSILLLDEPSKGLDVCAKTDLIYLFTQLQSEGKTIVVVSHDIEWCARYADRVSLLFDGQITVTDTCRRFFSSNSFYTTAAHRISHVIFEDAILDEDVINLCKAN